MVACKDADAMVTGNIRHYAASIEKLKHVCDARKGEPIFGMTMIVFKGRTVLVADTNVRFSICKKVSRYFKILCKGIKTVWI